MKEKKKSTSPNKNPKNISSKKSLNLILLVLFIIVQLIGLVVISNYFTNGNNLPTGFQTPEINGKLGFAQTLIQVILPAFVFAIIILFILSKYKFKWIIRIWFLLVVIIAIFLSINGLLISYKFAGLIAILLAVPLGFLKVFRNHFITHNLTELFIYPGIASLFVPLLNPISAIILLLIISAYDMWAVWHTDFMVNMAKFQMEEIKVFGGFLIPHLTKNIRGKIKQIKLKIKNKKDLRKSQGIKINLAILGGGDIAFPMMAIGTFLISYGLGAALFILAGATAGLIFLLANKDDTKAYPAMPYITGGVLIGLAAWLLTTFI